jgi:peptide/nickel transport system permease protein
MSVQEQAKLSGARPADDISIDTSIDRVDERIEAADERFYYATQWQLIRMRFRRHRLALLSFILLVTLYLLAAFAEFVSPYTATQRFEGYQMAPPVQVRLFDEDGLNRPFVFGRKKELDQETFKFIFTEDEETKYPVRFFVRGDEYKFWGLFRTNWHLFGTDRLADENAPPILLFGADELGRDLFSRTIYGARVSLSIGLIGVALSFVIGIILGGLSGYFGGVLDEIIQRTIDFLISIPQLPFWMALSAALPRDWPVIKTYFAITLILSVVGWSGLARVVRGKLLALREEDYALAAQAAGASQRRIIFRHLLPGFTSHLIVSLTLAVPGSILGETALSYLGLGMQPPAVSWGVLLRDAQDLVAIAQQPWRLIPALFVIGAVLLFNFVGDGLRDAADPYST